MKLTALFERFANPIMIKELRQAVRSWFILALFLLLLTLFTMVSLFVATFGYDIDPGDAGQIFFMFIYGILAVALLFFLPAYSGFRLGFERAGQDPDLLFVTTLSPGSIVRGKAMVAFSIALLFVSTALPFILFAYLLQGLDVIQVLVVLLLTTLGSLALSYMTMSIGAIPTSMTGKVVLLLLLLAGLGFVTFGAIVLTLEFITGYLSASGLGSLGADATFLLGWGTIFILIIVLCHSWIVCMISPNTSNRVLPVRITHALVWLAISLLLSWTVGWQVRTLSEEFSAWYWISIFFYLLSLFIAICEREEPGPRVARQIPPGALARCLTFPWYSGQVNGLAWSCGFACLILVIPIFITSYDLLLEQLVFSLTLILYLYAYAVTALLLRKYMFRNAIRPAHTWCICLMLFAVFFVGTTIISQFFGFSSTAGRGVPYGNLLLLVFEPGRLDQLIFAVFWAGIVTLLWLPWAFRQMRAFKSEVR